jgi:hypothetical protein
VVIAAVTRRLAFATREMRTFHYSERFPNITLFLNCRNIVITLIDPMSSRPAGLILFSVESLQQHLQLLEPSSSSFVISDRVGSGM